MLFPYQFLDHKMNKMQEYIQFILEDVWCVAIDGVDYEIDTLFAAKPDLRDMIKELDIHDVEVKGAKNFLGPLNSLFEKFKMLNTVQKQQFKDWFTLNNDIKKLCEDGDRCTPATYEAIKALYPEAQYPGLVSELEKFYKNMYSGDFLKLASVRDRIGLIADHNLKFTQLNDRDVCPFCGLSGILNQFTKPREAYDHYFPKGKYPFNSINFLNLVPACPHCNSSYKLAKDPNIEKPDTVKAKAKNPLRVPRKVFYPYANHTNLISLSLSIQTQDWKKLEATDVTLSMGSALIQQELDTWDDLYGISERYKAECCSKNSGKAWLSEVFERSNKLKLPTKQYVENIELDTELDPFVDKRFLRRSFLVACNRAGLFDIQNGD
ncbi:HNH endonuclease [Vibrio splendidus]